MAVTAVEVWSEPMTIEEPPRPGLRERKKAATMRHIQAAALELFRRDGFDRVTVEQVADAADVSPRTVYRYFGTKEGLILNDEYDDQVFAGLAHFLRQGLAPIDAAEAVLSVVEEAHFVADEEATRERVGLFFDNPPVRSAGYLLVDEKVDELAWAFAEYAQMPFPRARVVTSAIIWSIVAALKTWHESDGGPLLPHVDDAIRALRGLGE